MKRLIEVAEKEMASFCELKGVPHNGTFTNMGVDLDWRRIPDDVDFTGYELCPINVLYDTCRISIIFGDQNRINILLPTWIKWALYAARMQGQDVSIEILTKLRYENGCTKQKIEIPYSNTVG